MLSTTLFQVVRHVLLLLLLTSTRPARADLVSTDYDAYNRGDVFGHRPHQFFASSREVAPVLQVTTWDAAAVSTAGGSHFFLRHDGPAGRVPLAASPLVLDARDLSAVYVNRSFANVFGTRVQHDRGRSYLTFWAGRKGAGVGDGWGLAYDDRYRLAYNVSARHLSAYADLHEFALTGRGTALVTGINEVTVAVPMDEWKARLGYKGPSRLPVLDAVFQEIDLDTNEVLFDWRALDHLNPMDSYEPWASGWDVFHINSVEKTAAGNYLISIRHTHSIHLIDGTTGAILWTLGGKRNDFVELAPAFDALAPLLAFSWQHHPRFLPGTNETQMTFFDNHGKSTSQGQCPPGHCSRGVHLALDAAAAPPTVRLLREYTHPAQLRAQSQGSVQPLLAEDGQVDTVLVGWGRCPSFTEHTPEGKVVMDVQFSPWHSKDIPDALDNYRAYKMDWVATPWWDPAMAVKWRPDGRGVDVYVSWNGATEVREWVVRTTAAGPQTSRVLARSARTGFETTLPVHSVATANGGVVPRRIWAEALDASGQVIGTTDVVDLSSGEDVTTMADDDDEWAEKQQAWWDEEDEDDDGEQQQQSSSWSVGTILALVGGGMVGFAAVAFGVVVAWRRYSGVSYDRLEDDNDDDDDSDVDVEECGEYADLVFAPEAVVTSIVGGSRPEPWEGIRGKSAWS